MSVRSAVLSLLIERAPSWGNDLGRWWLLPDGRVIDVFMDWTTHSEAAAKFFREERPNDPAFQKLSYNDAMWMAFEERWIRGYVDSIVVPVLDQESLSRLRKLLVTIDRPPKMIYLDDKHGEYEGGLSIQVKTKDLTNPRMTPEALVRRAKAGHWVAEAVATDDITIHEIGDEDTARFYFEIGHGNSEYHVSEFDVEYTDPMTHEIWVLKHGEVQRRQQVSMVGIKDEGIDLSDPEALQSYVDEKAEAGQELPTWSHNEVWGRGVDDYWKGHYESDTGRLSVVNPGRFKVTGQLLGMLRAEFSPREIHVFQ